MAIMGAMYFRRTTKKKGGTEYDCWLLVESVRTALVPRQRVVAAIGKLPGLDREERIGWEEISRILSGKPRPTHDLFEQREEPPSWATVNMSGVSVERLRGFGDGYLGLLLWNKLGLADFCRDHIPSCREEVPWSIMAAISDISFAPDRRKNCLDKKTPYSYCQVRKFIIILIKPPRRRRRKCQEI